MSSEWQLVQLSSIVKIRGGKRLPAGKALQLEPNSHPYIRVRDVGQRDLPRDGLQYVPDELFPPISRYIVQRDDVVLSIVGTIGALSVVDARYNFASLTENCVKLHGLGRLDALYLFYYLSSSKGQQEIHRGTVGAVQPKLPIYNIEKIGVVWPGKTVREVIAMLLGSFDDRIALLRETNATLEAIAQALFKSWFVDFDPVRARMEGRAPEGMDDATAALFPDSFEESELGLVPKGWQLGTVGQFANVTDCLHAKKPELRETGRPFLQLNNIRDDGLLDTSSLSYVSEIDYRKWISRIEVSEGDCVITNVGRVGAVAQIPSSLKAAMGRNMTAIRTKNDWPYPTFLIELLQSKVMRAEIERRTDIGTILNALNVRNIPLLRCVLPPKAILAVFELTARPLRAAMEANLDRATSLATLRDTLLPRLISGQLRLPDAEAMAPETA